MPDFIVSSCSIPTLHGLGHIGHAVDDLTPLIEDKRRGLADIPLQRECDALEALLNELEVERLQARIGDALCLDPILRESCGELLLQIPMGIQVVLLQLDAEGFCRFSIDCLILIGTDEDNRWADPFHCLRQQWQPNQQQDR